MLVRYPAVNPGRYILLWRDRAVGRVSDTTYEFPWASGAFTPTNLSDDLKVFFQFMLDEDRNADDPPFDEALLAEDNWSMVDEGGARHGISVPAVRLGEGSIMWRWRATAG